MTCAFVVGGVVSEKKGKRIYVHVDVNEHENACNTVLACASTSLSETDAKPLEHRNTNTNTNLKPHKVTRKMYLFI